MANSESAVQIIPFYAHPHVHTVINDNTWYDEAVAEVKDPTDLPFATCVVTGADSGIDNTFVKLSDQTTKDALFGKANFNKYGQPSLQADQHFKNQNTNVWFCRVLPDNATYANIVVLAKYRKGKILDDLNQETGKSRLEIKFETAYVNKPFVTEGATTADVIHEVALAMTSNTADAEDGFMTLPLFYAYSVGRGKYGNNYALSLTRDTDAENEYEMKMYDFNLISTSPVTKVINRFAGSLYQTTKYDMSTLISDVIDQYSTGSCPIMITPFDDNFEVLYNFYQSIVAENAAYVDGSGNADEDIVELKIAQGISIDGFDPVFGLLLGTRTNEMIPYYRNYSESSEEWVPPDLTVPEGTMFDPPVIDTSYPGADGTTIGGGEVNLDDIDMADASTANGKPLNICLWNTAFIGARVLVCADPMHDGQRYVYTVVGIDAESGNITYDEGVMVAFDADQYTGVNLSRDVGYPMAGGSDGDFEQITVDGVTRAPNAAEMKLLLSREYVKAFRGYKDRKILSPARVNLDFIIDANYNMTTSDELNITGPTDLYASSTVLTDADYRTLSVIGGTGLSVNYSDLNVKKAIYDLNQFRNKNGMTVNAAEGAGCSIYLDCGLVGSKSIHGDTNFELQNVINMMSDFTGRATSIDLGYYEIFDPITKKRDKVTVTYFIAGNLVSHMLKYGINKPFVFNYATLRALQRESSFTVTGDMIRGTFRPDIDLIDWDVKEALYKSRINYYLTTDEGRQVQRAVQNTRQMDASALLEENNVRVLNTLKKGLEKACRGYLYEWNKASVRKAYTTAQMDIYRPWIGVFVEDLDIKFVASEWEQTRMIMHCMCEVKFMNIAKRIILEINVERPEYEADA